MKRNLLAYAAATTLALSPVGALAQHIDVGPGGVGVHGDSHGERHGDRHHDDHHEVVREHHHHDDHHDDNHGGERRTTVIERH
jgi:hypothetical protein